MNTRQLAKCNLFSNLKEEAIKQMLSEVETLEVFFAKGSILALQDELCNRLIVLIDGSVATEMMDPSGKVVKMENIEAPSPLAILFLFGQNNRFPVQIVASANVTALIIPRKSILKLLGMNEQLLTNYLDISAHYASVLSKKLHLMSFRTIRQKLAMYILDLSKEGQSMVELDRTQTSLAEYFGVSRPALARELGAMQQDGLIEVDRKRIVIKDPNKLIQLVRF